MEKIFVESLNSNIAVIWFVMAIIVLRKIIKKIPKKYYSFLWLLVGIRLFIPISIKSNFSLIPSVKFFNVNDLYGRRFEINSGIKGLDDLINSYISSNYYEGVTVPAGTMIEVFKILSIIWLIGILLLGVISIVKYFSIYKKIQTAICLKDNVWQSEYVTASFVFGLIKPKIYIPFNCNKGELCYILSHEKAHIQAKDHWIKMCAYIILIFNWYNPFLWIAMKLFSEDIEMACDERATEKMNIEEKKNYAKALLNCNVSKKQLIFVEQLFFSRNIVKERITKILNYDKPSTIVVVFSIILCVLMALCFLTDPTSSIYSSTIFKLMG
ncbi:MAG: M56 family metallopeptidase [Clostridia bacterium]|nr:M56 family metallopeptidase [Clostridia bacterium]